MFLEQHAKPVNITSLKIDLLLPWIREEWMPDHSEYDWVITWTGDEVIHEQVLPQIEDGTSIHEGFQYRGTTEVDCPVVPRLYRKDFGESGAYRYTFANPTTGETFDALVLCSFTDQNGYDTLTLVSVPRNHIAVWQAFDELCLKVRSKLNAGQRVHVIGGRMANFEPNTLWDDIVLPDTLKSDILQDVSTFFERGIGVYKRLKLKPFRKLLLAGVPGTGKTMLCTALAKWALDQGYLVIYISSADWEGPTFGKIDRALNIATNADCPTLILLEEIDAFLHDKQKAMVLNVLDGNESRLNPHGTMLVATTNYPEAIDERVLKRPGRLDRVFIVPPVAGTQHAEQMLRMYLGDQWKDEHRALVPKLVGYPGAFVREVVIYALTQCAYATDGDLPTDLLMRSFEALRAQIDARADLDKHRKIGRGFGFEAPEKAGNGSN
jgi:hypothetical protein